jgi:hypothetical protein
MAQRRAGCGKAACPVLGGAGEQLRYGKDIVAPSRKQADNRENKYFPVASGGSYLLEKKATGREQCGKDIVRRSKTIVFYYSLLVISRSMSTAGCR